MTSQPKISILLVNWNGLADTRECLQSLESVSSLKPSLIVVDNGSGGEDALLLKAEYPEVHVIETGRNLGFTGGNNVGIEFALKSSPDFIFLLNNDTLVSPDFLTCLLSAGGDLPQNSVLTPRIDYYDPAGEPWFVGSTLSLERGEAWHDNSRVPKPNESPYEIPWASGCAMLFPAALLKQLGGFEDRYFLNWEDVDLSMRVRRAGGHLFLVPASQIVHKVGRSIGKVSTIGRYYSARNNLLFVSLHSGVHRKRAEKEVRSRWIREALRACKQRTPGSLAILKATLRAFSDHRAERYGEWKPHSHKPLSNVVLEKGSP